MRILRRRWVEQAVGGASKQEKELNESSTPSPCRQVAGASDHLIRGTARQVTAGTMHIEPEGAVLPCHNWGIQLLGYKHSERRCPACSLVCHARVCATAHFSAKYCERGMRKHIGHVLLAFPWVLKSDVNGCCLQHLTLSSKYPHDRLLYS
jgi:hypothetical protein